jgi:hypothetical protein
MGYAIPIAVIALALIAAGSIAYIAWELTSKDIQDEIERSLGRPATEADPGQSPPTSSPDQPDPPEAPRGGN